MSQYFFFLLYIFINKKDFKNKMGPANMPNPKSLGSAVSQARATSYQPH
jgi:hypothetical protein